MLITTTLHKLVRQHVTSLNLLIEAAWRQWVLVWIAACRPQTGVRPLCKLILICCQSQVYRNIKRYAWKWELITCWAYVYLCTIAHYWWDASLASACVLKGCQHATCHWLNVAVERMHTSMNGSAFVWITACCLKNAKPLSGLMLNYCQAYNLLWMVIYNFFFFLDMHTCLHHRASLIIALLHIYLFMHWKPRHVPFCDSSWPYDTLVHQWSWSPLV